MFENWKLLKKERYLCSVEELEKKYKYGKTVTKCFLIPIFFLSLALFYYSFFESSLIISIALSIFLVFMLQFWFVFFLLSDIDDKNMELFLYLKKKEGE